MIKLQIHTVKDTVTACLLFVAVCAPLGVVRIITPELPAEEAIGQWVWFGKALLLSSICILIASLLQLMGKDTRKHVLRFSYFSVCVSWGFMLCGALEAIGGLWFCRFRSFALCAYRLFLQSGTVCGVSGNGIACLSAFVFMYF